jgi:hypothetical protein
MLVLWPGVLPPPASEGGVHSSVSFSIVGVCVWGGGGTRGADSHRLATHSTVRQT